MERNGSEMVQVEEGGDLVFLFSPSFFFFSLCFLF